MFVKCKFPSLNSFDFSLVSAVEQNQIFPKTFN